MSDNLPYKPESVHVQFPSIVDKGVPVDARTVIKDWGENTLRNTPGGNVYPGLIVYDQATGKMYKCIAVPDSSEVRIDQRTYWDCTWETFDSVVEQNMQAFTSVGFIRQGSTIAQGTTLNELVDMMFNPELDVTPVNPTVALVRTGTAPNTYEVGTTITPTLSRTYTDGYFKGVDPEYPDITWGPNQAAGCTTNGYPKYYRGSTVISSTADSYSDSYTLTNTSITYKVTQAYNANANTPHTNKGNDSSKTISAGTATSSTITYTGKYKYFVGVGNDLTASTIRSLSANGWIANSVNVAGEFDVPSGKYMIIAVPNGYKLSYVDSGFAGVEVTADFLNTLFTMTTISLDGSTYKVYYQNPIAETTKYLNVKLKNGN